MNIANRPDEKANSLVTIRADMNALSTIEGIVGECSLDALRDANQFVRTMKLAAGIGALRRIITNDMMADIMMLQGSSLGFRTDKDKDGGYPLPVVKDCMIEAVLKGAYMVGNEMNIISSRAYFTKEFYTRKLREFPGLTDLCLSPSVPIIRDTKAYVSYTATWKLDGRPDRMDRVVRKVDGVDVDGRIPVKVNAGMSDDAILGKAARKMMKSIYDYLTGSESSDGEVGDVPDGSGQLAPPKSLDQLADRISGSAPSEMQRWREEFASANSVDMATSILSKASGPERTAEENLQLEKWHAETIARINQQSAEAPSSTSETEWPKLAELIGKLTERQSEKSIIPLREAWVQNHPQHAEAIRAECNRRIAELKEAQKQQELIN